MARAALARLPGHRPGTRPGRKILIRTDGAGASHAFLDWCHGQPLSYSVGFGRPGNSPELLKKIPAEVWTPAHDTSDQIREGAWVAELTGLLDFTGWPPGMRVIARKKRPVRREALLIRTEVKDLRRRSRRSGTVKLRAA